MLLHVNTSSGFPVYLQIEGQVKQAIAAGALQQGNALPSVRKLAAELRVNPNTVAKAYQNLEREGVIRTVPGGGTYVADSSPGLLKSEKLRRAASRGATTGGRKHTVAPRSGRRGEAPRRRIGRPGR